MADLYCALEDDDQHTRFLGRSITGWYQLEVKRDKVMRDLLRPPMHCPGPITNPRKRKTHPQSGARHPRLDFSASLVCSPGSSRWSRTVRSRVANSWLHDAIVRNTYCSVHAGRPWFHGIAKPPAVTAVKAFPSRGCRAKESGGGTLQPNQQELTELSSLSSRTGSG